MSKDIFSEIFGDRKYFSLDKKDGFDTAEDVHDYVIYKKLFEGSANNLSVNIKEFNYPNFDDEPEEEDIADDLHVTDFISDQLNDDDL